MGDLAGYGGLISALNWLYWVVAFLAVWLAWRTFDAEPIKRWAAIAVALLFLFPTISRIYQTAQYQWKYRQAKALFDERCKTAGEKIYRTVEGVEGVYLLNIRGSDAASNRANPMWPNAALPNESGGDDYIRTFLYWEHNPQAMPRGYLNSDSSKATAKGYQYVDVKQVNGEVRRYSLDQKARPDDTKLTFETIKNKTSRYAISFDNEINPEDRKHWVAGTKITITDTQSGAVLAERQSYSFEPGLGNTSGARSPWGFAITCPSLVNERSHFTRNVTRYFADQIIKPIQGK